MGAAFLLLETKSVVQFALLFGTTWVVNSLVFGGILVSVLLAIEIASRWTPKRPGLLYAALLASLLVAGLGSTRPAPRAPAGPAVHRGDRRDVHTGAAGNLIFAERFRAVAASTTAFGVNLLGAILGGALEYSSVVLGFRWLVADGRGSVQRRLLAHSKAWAIAARAGSEAPAFGLDPAGIADA